MGSDDYTNYHSTGQFEEICESCYEDVEGQPVTFEYRPSELNNRTYCRKCRPVARPAAGAVDNETSVVVSSKEAQVSNPTDPRLRAAGEFMVEATRESTNAQLIMSSFFRKGEGRSFRDLYDLDDPSLMSLCQMAVDHLSSAEDSLKRARAMLGLYRMARDDG